MLRLSSPPDLPVPTLAPRVLHAFTPSALEAVAESIDEPWLGLDPEGRLLAANRVARRLLEAADLLWIERGRVVPADIRLQPAWREALAEVRAGRRRMLWSGDPAVRSILMQPGAEAVPVILRVGHDAIGRLRRLWAFAHAIGLSAQETRVLEGLVAGDGPAEIAERHEVAIATVRTQVRGVLGKAQVGGMRELLALVARLA
ncbi:MAG: hypothetical protein RJA99_4915 [Pseudomonadota bacterium]